jgi:undecaprenyl-diphosphatase
MRFLLKYVEARDRLVLLFFNHKIKCKLLDYFMPLITYLGSAGFTVTLCLAPLFSPNLVHRNFGVKSSFSLALSHLIAQVIKVNVSRIRPFLKIDNLNLIKTSIDQYSFPSGHTTASFSIGVMMCLFFPVLFPIPLILALIVGVSRMYLGVHYPTDVLIGMILGSLCSYIVYFYL